MGKHLHKYESLSAFTADYEDSESALTISFVCSAGTFTYDFYNEISQAYVWINQTKELWTEIRNPGVGTDAYDPDEGNRIEITQVNQETHEPKYIEPWVSATVNDHTESIHAAHVIDVQSSNYSQWQDMDLEYAGIIDYEMSDLV